MSLANIPNRSWRTGKSLNNYIGKSPALPGDSKSLAAPYFETLTYAERTPTHADNNLYIFSAYVSVMSAYVSVRDRRNSSKTSGSQQAFHDSIAVLYRIGQPGGIFTACFCQFRLASSRSADQGSDLFDNPAGRNFPA